MSSPDPSLTALLDVTREDNEVKSDVLARDDIAVTPLYLHQLKLDLIVERLFPSGTNERLQFDLAFETSVADILDIALAEQARHAVIGDLDPAEAAVAADDPDAIAETNPNVPSPVEPTEET